MTRPLDRGHARGFGRVAEEHVVEEHPTDAQRIVVSPDRPEPAGCQDNLESMRSPSFWDPRRSIAGHAPMRSQIPKESP